MNDRILRSTALAVLLGLPFGSAALAQTHHHDSGHAPTSSDSTRQADGTVRKVDTTTGKLTIAHGPLEGLGMPSMTMAFRVAERAMLEIVKVGDKIRFVPAQVGGELVVIGLEVVR
ncbi:MAG: copper-binding protein [Burkholderiaceae bacterium]|nr:copper-binding protein [Burkholderiaceae bacterium]